MRLIPWITNNLPFSTATCRGAIYRDLIFGNVVMVRKDAINRFSTIGILLFVFLGATSFAQQKEEKKPKVKFSDIVSFNGYLKNLNI
ncbi:MAG: hypothetical protein ACPG5W_07115, partial [Flavobacteriales bacterium]